MANKTVQLKDGNDDLFPSVRFMLKESGVTFPFVAEGDGFCNIFVRPSTSALSYIQIRDSISNFVGAGVSTGGSTYSVFFPVVIGRTYRISAISNADNNTARLYLLSK